MLCFRTCQAAFHAEVMDHMKAYGDVELGDSGHMGAAFQYGTGQTRPVSNLKAIKQRPFTSLY